MVTDKWRPGHWVEMTAIRGVGGPRHGVEEFHIITPYTGNLGGGHGSPEPLPQYEGKPNCECECWCTTGPVTISRFLFLGTPAL